MAWLTLLVAGALEVGWASAIPSTDGFRRPLPTALFVVCLTGSTLLLERAARSIPIATAYAIWVGIGALGTASIGILVRGEAATATRLGLLALLMTTIVGLKLTAAH